MKFIKNDIIEVDSRDIFSWLRYLKARQSHLLDNVTIEELVAFINGYVSSSKSDSDINDIWFVFDHFKTKISIKYPLEWEKYECKLSKIFASLESNQKQSSVNLFWKEWEEFEKTSI